VSLLTRWTDKLLDRALRPGRPTQESSDDAADDGATPIRDTYVLTPGEPARPAELDTVGPAPAAVVSEASTVPVIHWVDNLLTRALGARASDVHLEDEATGLRVRQRIDGVLEELAPPPPELRSAILARLRVMAGLNLAEHRKPQDGRIRLELGDRSVDVRVSTVPVLHGESVALRLLDPRHGKLELDDLGMLDHDLERLHEIIARPHGMILTTGPGGSGKSTTLFSIVKRISTGREKIFTCEDPVEYDFEGICQVQVNHRAGLTFPTLLRSLVRQDPDVLLVGEIRDAETADIAINAALTGHLLLSTLHTTDAISAMPRLLDLDVPDYLICHTLEAIMAQRLVRTICPDCAGEVSLTDVECDLLGPDAADLHTVTRARGCEHCRDSGYRGRTGLYEVLTVTDPLREAFLRKGNLRELRQIAIDEGLRTLRQDGIEKIRRGITTPAEVLRVT